MKRFGALATGLMLAAALCGCAPLATSVTDTLATNYGLIVYAQQQFGAQCAANPKLAVCTLVTKDIPLQNAAIDALEAYCGGTPAAGAAAFSAGGPCAPVKGLAPALQASINALTPVMKDLKPLVNPTTPLPAVPAAAPSADGSGGFAAAEAIRV